MKLTVLPLAAPHASVKRGIPLNLEISNIGDIPTKLQQAVKKWPCHIPFVFLTHDFIMHPSASSVTFSNDNVAHPNVSAIHEHDMSFDSWQSACRYFLELLKEFWPRAYKLWRTHYQSNYWGGLCTASNWKYMLEYDIMLRRNALPSKGVQPSMEYENLKEAAREKVRLHEKREIQGMVSAARLLPAVGTQFQPQQQRQFQPPSQYTQQPQQSFHSSQGFRGQQSSLPPKPVTPPQLHIEPPANRLAIGGPLTLVPSFCFTCGSNAHQARQCAAQHQINGKPIFAVRSPGSSAWMLPGPGNSRKRFCYNYNGLTGCSSAVSPCRLGGEHTCSRCGSGAHGATQCT